jgi:hypothetical protein
MGERWMPPDRFRPSEIDPTLPAGEQAEAMATARELEWLAATDDVAPSAGFADRVMAAVATEPAPRPVSAAASAARRGAVGGVLAAFVDLWRVAWTGGRPLAARAPAMALVVLILAGTVGAGALGVGALARLVQGPAESPGPSPVVSAEPSPSPSAEPSPSPSAEPSPSPSAEPSVSPTLPSPSAEPSESPEDGESPATGTSEPTRTPRPTETPRPTRTPRPTETPEPTETPKSDDD